MDSSKSDKVMMTKEEYELLVRKLKSKTAVFVLKRLIDISASVLLLLILSPLMILTAVMIFAESGFPVFFMQERMGRNGVVFKIYKFRTMKVGSATKDGITYKNDSRITKTGGFLRKYRLDEVPQLFNIIIGDMSLVGPRPDLPKYYISHDYAYKAVLLVRPGITGNATLAFKDEDEILSKSKEPEMTYCNEVFPEKIKLNVKYIENISVLNDIKLIFSTIIGVFLKK